MSYASTAYYQMIDIYANFRHSLTKTKIQAESKKKGELANMICAHLPHTRSARLDGKQS